MIRGGGCVVFGLCSIMSVGWLGSEGNDEVLDDEVEFG